MVALSRAIWLPLALAFVTAPGAAPQVQPELTIQPLSTTSNQCWTSGSGASYLKICITRHGNVILFIAPSGVENIARGEIGEGYVACAGTAANSAVTAYYDAASAESGWAEPYKVTTSPAKVYRKTTDGKLELVQSFSRDTAELDFTITMTLFNRSGKTLYNVRLDRYADFDVFGTVQGDTYHRTPRSVFAQDSGNILTMADLGSAGAATAIHSWSGWQKNVCNQPTAASPTSRGDWLGRISYSFGTMAKGASKTVTLVYSAQ